MSFATSFVGRTLPFPAGSNFGPVPCPYKAEENPLQREEILEELLAGLG